MPDRVPNINLLPQYERQSVAPFYIFIALIVIALVSYGLIGYYYFSTNSKVKKADEQYSELEEELELLQVAADEREADDASLEKAVKFAENYNMPTSFIIEELMKKLPENSYLSNYTYENREVTITSQFETLDVTADYTAKLVDSDFFTDAKLNNVTTFALKDEVEEGDFSTLLRYEANYNLVVDRYHLKGDLSLDE